MSSLVKKLNSLLVIASIAGFSSPVLADQSHGGLGSQSEIVEIADHSRHPRYQYRCLARAYYGNTSKRFWGGLSSDIDSARSDALSECESFLSRGGYKKGKCSVDDCVEYAM